MMAQRLRDAGAALLLAALLALTACKSGDPHSDDLFGGIAGMVSGNYDNRSGQREQQLLQTEALMAQQQQDNEQLTAISLQRAQTVQQLQWQVAALQSQTANLRNRIDRLAATRADVAGQVEAARARQVALQAELNELARRTAAGSITSEEITSLNDRKAKLIKEIAQLKETMSAIETPH